MADYHDFGGILGIFTTETTWPNPANLLAIPDREGFSLIDVGCGGPSGPEHLLGGLNHFGLDKETGPFTETGTGSGRPEQGLLLLYLLRLVNNKPYKQFSRRSRS